MKRELTFLLSILAFFAVLPAQGWAASWEQVSPQEVEAFKSGNLKEVKRILKRRGDYKDPITMVTALEFAATSGNVEVMRYLNSRGWFDRCRAQMHPCFPLHAAANGGANSRMLEYLIAEGFALDARGPLGMTPMLMAAEKGRFETTKYLCEAGADPDARSRGGATALQLAEASIWARHSRNPKVEQRIRDGLSKVIEYLKAGQCKKKPASH